MTKLPIAEIRELERKAENKRNQVSAELGKHSREAKRVSGFVDDYWTDWDHYEDRIEFLHDHIKYCLDLFTELNQLKRKINCIRLEMRKAEKDREKKLMAQNEAEGGKDD